MEESKQILERAIQKALDGGWDSGSLRFNALTPKRDGIYFTGSRHRIGINIDQGNIPEDAAIVPVVHEIDPKTTIFNHDFAKALWGDYAHTAQPGIDPFGEEDCDNCKASAGSSIPEECWQYHLQQMVIAKDPIEYLGENI